MSYSPTQLPAVQSVAVGTTAVDINVPAGYVPKLGALLLQRSADLGAVYWSFASGITTADGALIAKGPPGNTKESLIPAECFIGTRTFYLRSGTAAQTVDVLLV